MNENIKAWTKALRSGKYKQGTGSLRDGREFCCLGVACEVFIQHGGQLDVAEDSQVFTYDDHALDLPESVMEWLGLPLEEEENLMGLNDRGESFADIADYIERKLA